MQVGAGGMDDECRGAGGASRRERWNALGYRTPSRRKPPGAFPPAFHPPCFPAQGGETKRMFRTMNLQPGDGLKIQVGAVESSGCCSELGGAAELRFLSGLVRCGSLSCLFTSPCAGHQHIFFLALVWPADLPAPLALCRSLARPAGCPPAAWRSFLQVGWVRV